MKDLFRYELKKLFTKRFLFVVILILLCANAFNIYNTYDKYHKNYNRDYFEAEWKIYKLAEGELTQDRINSLLDYKNKLLISAETGVPLESYYINHNGDLYITEEILQKIKSAYQYSDKIDELLEINDMQKTVLTNVDNDYLFKEALLIEKTYSQRNIDSIYNTEAFGTYFSYDFSSFLILMIIFLGTASLFSGEKEMGMLSVIRSSKNGRIKLSVAKQTAALVYTFFVSIVFFVCDFLMFLYCLRLRGIFSPVYAISSFEYTPLNISVCGFLLLTCTIKIFGFIIFSLISSVLSSVFDKSYMVFAADFMVILLLMFMSAYSSQMLDYINIINPVNLLTNRNLFAEFNVINIIGALVFKYVIVIIGSIFLAIALSVTVCLLNNANSRRKAK